MIIDAREDADIIFLSHVLQSMMHKIMTHKVIRSHLDNVSFFPEEVVTHPESPPQSIKISRMKNNPGCGNDAESIRMDNHPLIEIWMNHRQSDRHPEDAKMMPERLEM